MITEWKSKLMANGSTLYNILNPRSIMPSFAESDKRNFLELVSYLSSRTNMTNGFAEPFSDNSGLTITNATIENGYVKNNKIGILLGDSIIPTMTGTTTGGVTFTASSWYSNTYQTEPWRAGDKSAVDQNGWRGGSGSPGEGNATAPQWLQVGFTENKQTSGYSIQAPNSSYRNPTLAWEVRGSTNGTDWVTIDTQLSTTFSAGQKRTYTFTETRNYRYYRLHITSWTTNGTTHSYPWIGEFDLFGTAKEVGVTMSSNTTPSGNTASASSIFSSTYPAWKVWNKTTTDLYDTWVSVNNSTSPQWNRLKMASPVTFKKYRLYGRGSGTEHGNPTRWDLQISENNGSTWTTIDSRTGQSISMGGFGEYTLSSAVTCSDIRILVHEWTPPGAGYNFTTIGAIRLYEEVNGGNEEIEILTSPIVASNLVEGKLTIKVMNVDNPTTPISIGNTNDDLVSVEISLDNGTTYSKLAFDDVEDAQLGYFRYTSSLIDLSTQTGIRIRIKSYNRGSGAPNIRIDDVILVWR